MSVVIPTYNRKGYVQEAIDSVLAQTYTDYEIIVVDDGSTDGTSETLRARYGDRIRYVWQENQGESAARNRGIQMARGEFIAFLDSDDLWLPQKLERQMAFAKEHPEADWISSGWRVTDLSGNLIFTERSPWQEAEHEDKALRLLMVPSIPSVTLLRRTVLQRVGGFDSQLRYKEDHDLWLRLLARGHEILFVPAILADLRVHDANQSQDCSFIEAEDGLIPVLDKLFSRESCPSQYCDLRDALYARAHLRRSCFSFARGDVSRALGYVEQALALDPSLRRHAGKRTLDTLLGFATSRCVGDPISYARLVLNALPDQPFLVRERWGKLMGRAAAGAYFTAAQCQDWPRVRTTFCSLVRYDPTWLRNRGIWSILLTGLVGPGTADKVRHIARRALTGYSTVATRGSKMFRLRHTE